MNPHAKNVKALDDYQLALEFENYEGWRIFDMKPYLNRGIFVRLQDRALLQAARVVAGSLESRPAEAIDFQMAEALST